MQVGTEMVIFHAPKQKQYLFSYINQKPMWLLNNFESNLYFVNYIPKIVFLYLPPMDQLSSPNLLLSPSATLILTNSLPIYWSLWLSLSISIDHPVSASFEQVGQCTNATLLKQGQIGLERSASWSLIPINGPRGSRGGGRSSQLLTY